ncbi:MAG: hypothetical protein GX028_05265 [Clostridiaceae bacterium]|nr:hypothetical protein [Clostridiaceae bacterium]
MPADIESAARNGFMMYETKETGEHIYTIHQGNMSKEDTLIVLKEMGNDFFRFCKQPLLSPDFFSFR